MGGWSSNSPNKAGSPSLGTGLKLTISRIAFFDARAFLQSSAIPGIWEA